MAFARFFITIVYLTCQVSFAWEKTGTASKFSRQILQSRGIGKRLPTIASSWPVDFEVKTVESSASPNITSGYFVYTSYSNPDCTGITTSITASAIGGCLDGNQEITSISLGPDTIYANYAVIYSGTTCTGTPAAVYTAPYSTLCSKGNRYSWNATASIPGTFYTSGYQAQSYFRDNVCSGPASSVGYVLLNQCINEFTGYTANTVNVVPGGFYASYSYFAGSTLCTGLATSFYTTYYSDNQCISNPNSILSYVPALPVVPGVETVGYFITTSFVNGNCMGDISQIGYVNFNSSICVTLSPPKRNAFYVGTTANYSVVNIYSATNCMGPVTSSTVTLIVNDACTTTTYTSVTSTSVTFSRTIEYPAIIGYGQT